MVKIDNDKLSKDYNQINNLKENEKMRVTCSVPSKIWAGTNLPNCFGEKQICPKHLLKLTQTHAKSYPNIE